MTFFLIAVCPTAIFSVLQKPYKSTHLLLIFFPYNMNGYKKFHKTRRHDGHF